MSTIALTEQQYDKLKAASLALSAVFAEDKAEPSPADQILFAISEEAHKEGFEEPGSYLRSLMPNKGDFPLAVAGVGAGMAGTIAGILQAKLGFLASLDARLVSLVVGWLLYRVRNQWVSAFGGGVVIGTIGAFTFPFVSSALGGAASSGGGGGGATSGPNDIAAGLGA